MAKKTKTPKVINPITISFQDVEIEQGSVKINSLYNIVDSFYEEHYKENADFDAFDIYKYSVAKIEKNLDSKGLKDDDNVIGKLSALIPPDEITDIEKMTVEYFKSIPKKYWYFISCPYLRGNKLGFRNHNDTYSTVESIDSDHGLTIRSLASGIQRLNDKSTQNGLPKGFYFRIAADGFATTTNSHSDSASTDAIRKFKHLLIGLLIEKKVEIGFPSPYSTEFGSIFLTDVKELSTIKEIQTPENLRRLLAKIKLPEKAKESTETNFLSDLLGTKKDETNYFLEKISSGLAIIFDASETSEDVECIRTSMEWLFDAKLNSDDPSLKVMQLAAAAEAVLAEGKKIENNVTKTLADRCAYLLGSNAKQRAEIRSNFSDFYNIRSSLVHGRSRMLKPKDKNMIRWAESLVTSIIKKEVLFLSRKK